MDIKSAPNDEEDSRDMKSPGKGSIVLASSPPNSPEASKRWSDLIKVSVGPEKQPFIVHREFWTKIPFLETLLNANNYGGHPGEIELLDANIEAFDVVLHYIYMGKQLDLAGRLGPVNHWKVAARYGVLLAQTYILADQLHMEDLCNDATDCMRKLYQRSMVSKGPLDELVKKSMTDEPITSLLLRIVSHNIRSLGWERHSHTPMSGSILSEFFRESMANAELISKALLKYQDVNLNFLLVDSCEYHKHIKTNHCALKRLASAEVMVSPAMNTTMTTTTNTAPTPKVEHSVKEPAAKKARKA